MDGIIWFSSTTLTELVLLVMAFVLSAIIGLERNRKLKSAGLRTHTLVGVGSAVFTLVSAYGFAGVLGPEAIVDPSRIAAQIVSGIGFLGAGVIFVRRGGVSGLTTAASIWLTAAIGMACGAGVPTLAIIATALHLLAVTVLGRLGQRVARPRPHAMIMLRYRPGQGTLPEALSLAARRGTPATLLAAETNESRTSVCATVQIRHENESTELLVDALADLAGVTSVRVVSDDELEQG